MKMTKQPLLTHLAPALWLGSLVAVMFVSGCSVATNSIRSDFPDYNGIIQFNQMQQMVVNLVRMHYRESPLFLQAGSVTAAYESRAEISSEATLDTDGTPITIGGNYQFASKPTVSYTPVEGKAYVQQFMSEISYDSFALLVRAGWPAQKLVSLLVERYTTESGEVLVNDHKSNSYGKFEDLLKKIQSVEEVDRVGISRRPKEGYDLMLGGLRIPVERLQMRSLVDVMFFASQDVETPPDQASRTKKFNSRGNLSISYSKTKPKNAMVWAEYNGYYYSVAQNDIEAKDTLALLVQISRIQSGPPGPAPLLTIPANN